jgi:hypothetical protein
MIKLIVLEVPENCTKPTSPVILITSPASHAGRVTVLASKEVADDGSLT